MVYLHGGILYSNKKEQTTGTQNSMHELKMYCVTKRHREYILCNLIYEPKKKKKKRTKPIFTDRKQNSACLGRWGMGIDWVEAGKPSRVMEIFCIFIWEAVARMYTYGKIRGALCFRFEHFIIYISVYKKRRNCIRTTSIKHFYEISMAWPSLTYPEK